MNIPRLPIDFVNRDHRDAQVLIESLATALPDDIPGILQHVLEHSREHFAREEAMMQETGFPPYPMHHAEHQKFLAELVGVVDGWAALGETERTRYIDETLPHWFVQHIQTMDTVTALWAERQGYRG